MTSLQAKANHTAKALAVCLAFFIPISTTITQVLLGGIIVAICIAGKKTIKARFELILLHPVARMAMLLFLLFCIGVSYAAVPLANSLAMLAKMSKLLCVPILIPLFVEQKWRKAAVMAFLSAMLLTLFLELIKNYLGFSFITFGGRYHDGVFKNHIDTNFLMSMAAFFLAQQLFVWEKIYQKALLITILSLMTFYIFCISGGRTGYFVFAALFLLLLVQRLNWKQYLLGSFSLLLILSTALFCSPQLQQRLTDTMNELVLYNTGDTSKSLGQRLEYLQSSIAIIKHKPLCGFGTGGFKTAYAAYAIPHGQSSTSNPHNEYLNILVQWGFLGLALFLAFAWIILRLSFVLPLFEKYLIQGVILGILIGCTANSFLMDITPGYFFVTFIAISMAAYPWKTKAGEKLTLLEAAKFGKMIGAGPENALREGVV